jgi:hypothetical protein
MFGWADPAMASMEATHLPHETAPTASSAAEAIKAPAVKSGAVVVTGPGHPAIEAATGLKAPQEGFVTTTDKFVPRKEGAAIAEKAGQAAPEATGIGLHSEDLPPQNRPPVQAQPAGAAIAEKIPSAPAKDVRMLINQQVGLGTRDSKQAVFRLQPFEKHFNSLDKEDVDQFWKYVETRSTAEGAALRKRMGNQPDTLAMADEFKKQMEERRFKLELLDDDEKMSFVQDYAPHIYDLPKDAKTGKIGTGAAAFLKKRKIPTYEEAVEAGLTPKYSPLETVTRYTAMMDKHIALKNVREIAKDAGIVQNMAEKLAPEGYTALNGTRNAMGQALFAPDAWAKIYNRYTDAGFSGKGFEIVRQAANVSRGIEFALGFRHALTIYAGAVGASVGHAVSHLASGDPFKAGRYAAEAPVAAVRYFMKGDRALKLYEGASIPSTKREQEIISALTQVNAHMGALPKYLQSAKSGNLWSSYKAGSFPKEWEHFRKAVAERQSILGKTSETAKGLASAGMRAVDTVIQPVFGYAIPRVKAGVSFEMYGDWLEHNPSASHEEKLAMATKISHNVDNTFGEMMLDTRFWNKKVQQSLETGLLSVGWSAGFYDNLIKGTKSLATSGGRSLSMKSPHYDARSVGLVGGIVGTSLVYAAYQYLKIGKAPEELMDLVAPKTGGQTRYGTPERLTPFTNEKEYVDLFLATQDAAAGGGLKPFVDYGKNKLVPAFRLAAELLSNSDWRGDPIFDPASAAPGGAFDKAEMWTGNVLGFLWGENKPMSFQDRREAGSNISEAERLFGLQPAGVRVSAPEASQGFRDKAAAKAYKGKVRHEAVDKDRYGGTQ